MIFRDDPGMFRDDSGTIFSKKVILGNMFRDDSGTIFSKKAIWDKHLFWLKTPYFMHRFEF